MRSSCLRAPLPLPRPRVGERAAYRSGCCASGTRPPTGSQAASMGCVASVRRDVEHAADAGASPQRGTTPPTSSAQPDFLEVRADKGDGGEQATTTSPGLDAHVDIFRSFDSDGDDVLQRREVEGALMRIGAVPLGGDKEALVEECLAGLAADSSGSVTIQKLKENHGVIESLMTKSGIDHGTAAEIAKGILEELGTRGCLRTSSGSSAVSRDGLVASRAVSLEVVPGMYTALQRLGDYDVPTFSYAVWSACHGPRPDITAPQRCLVDLLSSEHVGVPTAFVSHMWTSPRSVWPGQRPFTFAARQVLSYYDADALTCDQRAKIFVWMDVFAVCQAPGGGSDADLEGVKAAIEAAREGDGTLLVLDPHGMSLTRSWCLLEIWWTSELAGPRKLHVLADGIQGLGLQEAWQSLDISKAEATRQADRDRVLEAFRASGRGLQVLSSEIKAVVIESVEADANGATGEGSREQPRHAMALGMHATMLQYCADKPKEAEVAFRRSLELLEASVGPSDARTVLTMQRLAALLLHMGSLEEAETLARRAVTCHEATKQTGNAKPGTLDPVSALAAILHAKGDLPGAEVLFRQALTSREAALGLDHLDTLDSANSLAVLLREKGDLVGAEPLYRRALEGREAKLGPRHTLVLVSFNNLALLLQLQGHTAKAEELHRRALAGRKDRLGADHPQTIESMNNLALLLTDMGNVDEAEALYRTALGSCEDSLGPDHQHTLSTANNLAFLLRQRGELAAAEPLYQKVLTGFTNKLGPKHQNTLTCMNGLATLLRDMGKLAAALPLFEEVLAGFESTLGPLHLRTLDAVNVLATALKDKGDLVLAEPLFQRALEGCEAELGPTHPLTLTTLHNLALLQSRKGDLQLAVPLFRRALEGFESTLGADHPHTVSCVAHLGAALKDSGELEGAEPLLRRALQANEARMGPRHLSTHLSKKHLAAVLDEMGGVEESEPLYREALEGLQSTLGPDHPQTQHTSKLLHALESNQKG